MKRFLHHIGSVILAFIVLFSSFSFAIDTHYCGEHLVDTAYFGKAAGCDMDKEAVVNKDLTVITKKSCCKNVTEFIASSEFRKEQLTQFTQAQLVFLVSFVGSYLQLIQETILQLTFYNDFSPPDIFKDIRVLYQSFLI